ncbi:MAG: phosphoglucosamine mutase [Cyclobacteriaceae bacterium]|nr:MAG: phosphoglucosamine mutase [Cyclobacteriaceae bacterium]
MTLITSISGIRGTTGGLPGTGLTPPDIVKFTAAYSQWLLEHTTTAKVVVGRDARISGKLVSQLVCATLQSMGIDVVDLGLSTTPTVEMAVPEEKAGGGIIITASHNPAEWNALKLLNSDGEFISQKEGEKILEYAQKAEFNFASYKQLGKYDEDQTYLLSHIQKITELPLVDLELIKSKNFKIAVDAVNSTGGIAVPLLLRTLGVTQVVEFHCEPNGKFPRNPEPIPENLGEFCREVEKGQFDLGIVVDPDVDRLAFVQENGEPFGEEYTLVAVADYVLENHPGGSTVSNLSSTRALRDITEKHGGNYYASAVGEVNVVSYMKKYKAPIGGEGNGGIIYPALHYGRDALVGIALFLTKLAKYGHSVSRLRASYPNYHISKQKIELTPDIDVDALLSGIRERYSRQPINDIDGIKIEFDKEWVHLRKSNTEPIIRIYTESETMATAEYLGSKIISDMKEIITNNH